MSTLDAAAVFLVVMVARAGFFSSRGRGTKSFRVSRFATIWSVDSLWVRSRLPRPPNVPLLRSYSHSLVVFKILYTAIGWSVLGVFFWFGVSAAQS